MATACKATHFHGQFGGHGKSPVAVVFSLGVFNPGCSRYTQRMVMQVFFGLMLFGVLTAITWSDFRTQTIPDVLNVTLSLAGMAACAVLGTILPADATLGLALGAAVPLVIRYVFKALRGLDGLGMGDVKFLAASGVWIGSSGLPWVVLLASLSGLAFAIAQHLAGRNMTRQTRLAFGPHLAFGLFVTWILKLNGML